MNMPSSPAAESPVTPPAEPSVASPADPPLPLPPGPRDILKALCARFPVFRAGEPLAIGIDKAVRAELPDLCGKNLRIALSIHTHSNRYLRNMAKAGQRLDLQGAPAGEITDGQRQYAAGRLQERLKKQAEAAANTTTPAPRRKRPEKTPSPAPAPRPQKAAAPRRETRKPPPEAPENGAALSLAEKLALLSEKFSRK
ncbi:MAG: ProQ/FINO family protein [Zoogloeaceae bacterium]|jgi:ProP effector|nr:ProQ/FINO family protein [Zoogloeaceae bacterium]